MGTKNIGALFAILLIIMGLWGCSQEGNLVVKNESATEFQGYVEDQPVVIDHNMEYRTTVYIGKTLALIGPKDINVIITGSSWTTKLFKEEVQIKSGETAIYEIVNDVGACDFSNAFHLSVNALNVKPCDSTRFGPNILEERGSLAPGQQRLLQLDPGCWDILVNYGKEGFLDTVTAVPIEIGKIDTLPWVPGYADTKYARMTFRP